MPDAAPLHGSERLTTQENSKRAHRLRRRGPRSVEALHRRASRYVTRRLEREDGGQSIVDPPEFELKMQPLKVLVINIRSLMGKLTELEHDWKSTSWMFCLFRNLGSTNRFSIRRFRIFTLSVEEIVVFLLIEVE